MSSLPLSEVAEPGFKLSSTPEPTLLTTTPQPPRSHLRHNRLAGGEFCQPLHSTSTSLPTASSRVESVISN